jgi:hypothetical protein
MMLCSLVGGYTHFRGTFHLDLQDNSDFKGF